MLGYAGAHGTTMSLHGGPRECFRNAADNKDNNSILLPTFALPLLSFLSRKTFSIDADPPRTMLSCRSTYLIIYRGIGKCNPKIQYRVMRLWESE